MLLLTEGKGTKAEADSHSHLSSTLFVGVQLYNIL